MNSFADKKEKPTTDEYLKEDLKNVLDRLNKNPNGLQSEEVFVQAVITVRNAMITEKLTRWLIGLTSIVAIATVLLVVVPFFTPSFEAKKIESKIVDIQSDYKKLQGELAELRDEVQTSRRDLSEMKDKVQTQNKANTADVKKPSG